MEDPYAAHFPNLSFGLLRDRFQITLSFSLLNGLFDVLTIQALYVESAFRKLPDNP